MALNFQEYLLKITSASHYKEVEIIQSLWSGYGKISRLQLFGAQQQTVVVKNIVLAKNDSHPRGWGTDMSHERKLKSYEVESCWYEQYSQNCNSNCRVPKLIGSFSENEQRWIVMEDLSVNFPSRKEKITLNEVKACLRWLANFHATFLNEKRHGLWEIGTYWHLATRPQEFQKIEHDELKTKAHLIDKKLNNCKYKTIVHGDAKLANFCFSTDGRKVAGVDFQYVGGGCGMKDVAYFLGSCLSSVELSLHDSELLNFYFSTLQLALADNDLIFGKLETEWREMYPLACADFTRFLSGWMPSHQKINDYQLTILDTVLAEL